MRNYIEFLNESNRYYLAWKRKNVTLRGIKKMGQNNGVYGSFGNGLYTVPLSNRAMAKQYGKVYFVVNAIPTKPKIVYSLNDAEIWRYNLIENYCKKHNTPYSGSYFESNTTIEEEMLKLGYDGLVIKGREMVNYKPHDILYFETEYQLERYYETKHIVKENYNKKYDHDYIKNTFQKTLSCREMVDFILNNSLNDSFGKLDYNDAKEIAYSADKWNLELVNMKDVCDWVFEKPYKTNINIPPIYNNEVLDGKTRLGYLNWIGVDKVYVYVGKNF